MVGALDTALSQLAQDAPAVVVDTISPFTTTAVRVARPARRVPLRRHRQRLATVESILNLDRRAVGADQVLVTGAGSVS